MSNCYIIEIGGRAVGLVQKCPGDSLYMFFASDRRFDGMEGRTFRSARAAELAAGELLRGPRPREQGRSGRESLQRGSQDALRGGLA